MDVIQHSAGAIVPQIIDGYQVTRDAHTIVHTVLGRVSPDVTLRDAGTRRGELSLVFEVEGVAHAAVGVLSSPQVLTLVTPDRPTLGMQFVVADGSLSVELDDETRDAWVVRVPFVEVTA